MSGWGLQSDLDILQSPYEKLEDISASSDSTEDEDWDGIPPQFQTCGGADTGFRDSAKWVEVTVRTRLCRMTALLGVVFCTVLLVVLSQGREVVNPARDTDDTCDISDWDKRDCGYVGTNQYECEQKGCCWRPVQDKVGGIPWCYYKDGGGGGDCDKDSFNWEASGPGFTDAFYNTMKENYRANLNVKDCGAVVAAPDGETPGGSYYYHWMRDAGLSIKAWLDINDNNHDAVKDVLEAYQGWVAKVQQKNDPNGIDVRVEPKFTIPDGEPYTGGWCRPQTDGPALRAMAMSKWGRILVTNKRDAEARADVWPLVKFDMEWVTANWRQSSCDLWEEFTSDDFYWNRMAFVYSLNAAADFADSIGQDGGSWRSVASEIAEAARPHFNGEFIYEAHGREKDGSVIHAIITFGEFLHPASSSEAAKTVDAFNKAFCWEYPINQQENGEGKPGVLIGRYPGDSYAGGNPWQLLTAAHAELHYLVAEAAVRIVEDEGKDTRNLGEGERQWGEVLGMGHNITALDLAKKSLSAGNAIMTRLWEHVKNDGGRVDEQIDKHTGKQASAEALTWSYANILHALHTQRRVTLALNNVQDEVMLPFN